MNEELNEDFVPYEESLTLRKLGFDEPCLAVYRSPEFMFIRHLKGWKPDELDNVINSVYGEGGFCTAPLYQQAFKWFKKEHGMHVFIDIYPTEEQSDRCWYMLRYMDRGEREEDHMSGWFDNQEAAELGAIKKLINVVKEKEE